jgi:hypothetical protein
MGITGWEPGEAIQAARTCFDAWLSRRGGQGNQEEKAMLRQVREFIRRKGESAFTDWDRPANDTDKHAPGKPDRAGYRRGCHDAGGNDAQEYFLFNEAWRGVVCKGHDAAAVGVCWSPKGIAARAAKQTARGWFVRACRPRGAPAWFISCRRCSIRTMIDWDGMLQGKRPPSVQSEAGQDGTLGTSEVSAGLPGSASPERTGDDRRRCLDCAKRAANGRCMAAAKGSL